MKVSTIITFLICIGFISAQAAVDSGRKAQTQLQIPNAIPNEFIFATDLQLKERVQQHLRTSLKNYDPNQFSISTQNGEVTLQGMAKTQEEAQQIAKEILRVNGVSRVKNNLKLNVESN